jgi:hypothetical protein
LKEMLVPMMFPPVISCELLPVSCPQSTPDAIGRSPGNKKAPENGGFS